MNDSATPARSLAQRLPFFYGWVVVAVAFVTMAIGVNVRTSFSLLLPPILGEFGWATATLSATFTIGFVTATVVAPIAGAMMDRWGPRFTLPVGAVITGTGLALATFAREPWHFYLTLGLMVVGGSMFISYIGHILFVPNWFARRRGLSIGLAFAGVGVGAVTLLPVMQMIINAAGWRAACLAASATVIAVVVPLNMTFQRRRPEDLGLRPDGDAAPVEGEAAKGDGRPPPDPDWAAVDWTLVRAMATARFWWLLAALSAGLYAWYAVQVHQTKYLVDIGITAELAAVALGLVPAAGIAGQIVIGHLSDKLGREIAWTVALAGYTATYALLLVMEDNPSELLLYAMVGCQGLLGYGLAAVYAAVPVELFGGRHYGRIFGVLAAASGTAAGVGPWVTGLFHDAHGGYAQGFAFAAFMSLFAIAAMWIAAPRKVRPVR